MIQAMLITGLGGFIGTCLRFLLIRFCQINISSTLPWGTLLVNLIGSFIVGILFGIAEKNNLISSSMNLFLITGFCGGFTTFSTFSNDMFTLLEQRQWGYFSIYITLSFVLGILLVWLGRTIISK